jgi:septal ring factor EnvC (AmiA/AmiB activator)
LSLRPATFHYKNDTKGTSQFGLIAEEVAKVNPALVLPDQEGKPYSVRYDAVNAMLLNEFLKQHSEFLKEHKTVQEQGATIEELKKEITALTATVKDQAAQIQKVIAQLELSKSAPSRRVRANTRRR